MDNETYDKKILGTWAEYTDSENNIMVYATDFPDGRYHTYGYFPDGNETYFFADGRWNIDDGISCITVEYESSKTYKPGDIVCNRIVKIDSSVYIFDSNGDHITMKRISSGKL